VPYLLDLLEDLSKNNLNRVLQFPSLYYKVVIESVKCSIVELVTFEKDFNPFFRSIRLLSQSQYRDIVMLNDLWSFIYNWLRKNVNEVTVLVGLYSLELILFDGAQVQMNGLVNELSDKIIVTICKDLIAKQDTINIRLSACRREMEDKLFSAIEARQCYQLVLQEKIMDKFVEYLVAKDQIQNLLKTLIRFEKYLAANYRFESAIKLLLVYNSQYSLIQVNHAQEIDLVRVKFI
jgi:hypothetical protein